MHDDEERSAIQAAHVLPIQKRRLELGSSNVKKRTTVPRKAHRSHARYLAIYSFAQRSEEEA